MKEWNTYVEGKLKGLWMKLPMRGKGTRDVRGGRGGGASHAKRPRQGLMANDHDDQTLERPKPIELRKILT